MKIIQFEPGDGTRYVVGIARLSRESSLSLDYENECYLFLFGTMSSYRVSVINSSTLSKRNLRSLFGFSGDYMNLAAYSTLSYILNDTTSVKSTSPDSDYQTTVSLRWDEAAENRKFFALEDNILSRPWKSQLWTLVKSLIH